MKDIYSVLFVILFFSELVLLAILMFYQHKVSSLLREKFPEKWKQLTTTFGIGPGCQSGFKGVKFYFEKDEIDDPEIIHFKLVVRNCILCFVFMGLIQLLIILL